MDRNATLDEIRECAAEILNAHVDPLDGARMIDVKATELGVGLEEPFIVLKGIVANADDIVDVAFLQAWEPAAANAKAVERAEFLAQYSGQIRDTCLRILQYDHGYKS